MKSSYKFMQGASKQQEKPWNHGFFACSEQKHDKILGYSEFSIDKILSL